MADTLSTNLGNLISTKASWGAPCTFTRSNAMPLDKMSCFQTRSELDAYVAKTNNAQDGGTAYPGMFVAVTDSSDEDNGAYIIVSNGTSLVPMKLGVSSSDSGADMFWLRGDGSQI